MARSWGNNRLNYLEHVGSLISDADPRPISVAVWLKANDNNVLHWIFTNTKSNNPNFAVAVRGSNGDDAQVLYAKGYAANSTPFTLSVVSWTHLGWSWDTDNDIEHYLNGAANGVAARAAAGQVVGNAVIGTLDGGVAGFDIDGDLAEFAVWSTILTSSEWASLAKGYSPLFVRPQSLVSYPRIMGRNSPELDQVSSVTWAINGTLPVAPHVPVIYPAPPHITYISAAVPPPVGPFLTTYAGYSVPVG